MFDFKMNTGNFSQIPTHLGIACGNCNSNPIIGNRYKCMQCPNYDLCSQCFNHKMHNFHPIGVIYAPGQMPSPIPQCQQQPQAYPQQQQPQYSAQPSIFFQQTQPLQQVNQSQSNIFPFFQSIFESAPQPFPFAPTKPQTHMGTKCNHCNNSPIIGNRYNCTQCFGYDLCENCKNMNIHPMHGFHKISSIGAQPVFIPAGQLFEQPQGFSQNQFTDPFGSMAFPFGQVQSPDTKVNTGMRCDHCGVIPIIGKVFKCSICQFFYLCDTCKNKAFHSQHVFNLFM
jgi:Zinc finger, ZZ type